MRTVFSIIAAMTILGLTATATAETVWATEDTQAQRWQDNAEIAAGDVTTGDRLEVIHRTDGWVRVRLSGSSATFGWLPETKVTSDRPATDDLGGLEGLEGLPPGLDLPGGFDLGGGLPPINLDLK